MTKKDPHAELMAMAIRYLSNEDLATFYAAARTLTDRIAELEAQLEAVGAGCVGAMAISVPSALTMPDKNWRGDVDEATYKAGWNDCRNAMLAAQAAQPAPAAVEPMSVKPLFCPKCRALWLFWPKEISGMAADTLNLRSAKSCDFCESASADKLESPTAPQPRQIAEPASQWISVDERLPGEQGHDSEEVMCFLSGHCAMTDFECRNGASWGIRLGYYDAERGMFRIHGSPDASVTHWTLLPPPPATPKDQL